MSVDYYACSCCGEAIYEEAIVSCKKCGKSICDECVVENEFEAEFYFPDEILNEQGELKSEYCPFCSGKEVAVDDLLEYALKKLDQDYNDLKNEYLANR